MANVNQSLNVSPKSLIIPYASQSVESSHIYQFLIQELNNYLAKSPKFSPLMQNLQILLNEVRFTKSKKLQDELLIKIKQWYDQKSFSKTRNIESSTPKPQKILQILKEDPIKFNSRFIPYIPKKIKVKNYPKKDNFSNSQSINSFDVPFTRASSSEPSKPENKRRMSQSPGIIMSIVNNFIKNKRVKTYNFTLEAFLEDSKHKKVMSIDEKITRLQERPMTSTLKHQIEEVQNVKLKLANRKIPCGFRSIFQGLVVDDNANETHCNFPQGGENLIKFRKLLI
ncbi:hypothetical protein SteCoe_30055 [Stentor coeruleus]|uniref:Uncharacterized protein n=1 Tax=Stentor coeruleus TaxID=5963 RepID=A0A1R2B4G9_9CILI|nr:hypothetical protein SteCoe_30055 [Stentor coeruleus]